MLQQPDHPVNSKDVSFNLVYVSHSFGHITFNVWHKRLGHPSFSRIKRLPHLVSHVFDNNLTHCDVCPLAKHKRLPFPSNSQDTSSCPFELIHRDIWGPFQSQSIDGFKYFLTIVDDYSRSTWGLLIKV